MAASESLGRWSWFKILIGGLLLFYLLERALAATGNPNFVPSLLMVGTFTIPLAFCALLYTRKRQPDVPRVTLGLCIIWGGVLGTVVAGRLRIRHSPRARRLTHTSDRDYRGVGKIDRAALFFVSETLPH